jgi:hypothetical protein
MLLTHKELLELEVAFSRREQMHLCIIQQEKGSTQATLWQFLEKSKIALDNYADVLSGLTAGLPPIKAKYHSRPRSSSSRHLPAVLWED